MSLYLKWRQAYNLRLKCLIVIDFQLLDVKCLGLYSIDVYSCKISVSIHIKYQTDVCNNLRVSYNQFMVLSSGKYFIQLCECKCSETGISSRSMYRQRLDLYLGGAQFESCLSSCISCQRFLVPPGKCRVIPYTGHISSFEIFIHAQYVVTFRSAL